VALVLCLWAIVGLEAAFSIRVIYTNAAQIAEVNSEIVEMQKIHSSKMSEMSMRLDMLEKVLFGDVLSKIAAQPKGIETWQQNRDREMRERISKLELWRLHQDAR
jgi:hypothetical protein